MHTGATEVKGTFHTENCPIDLTNNFVNVLLEIEIAVEVYS